MILYDSFSDFQQANAVPGLISPGEGGVTESLGGRILIPLTGVPADDDHVLGHELVHAFQFSALRVGRPAPLVRARSLPTWFVEGMAEYLSLGPRNPLTAMWMRDALLTGDVPGVDEIAGRPDAVLSRTASARRPGASSTGGGDTRGLRGFLRRGDPARRAVGADLEAARHPAPRISPRCGKRTR